MATISMPITELHPSPTNPRKIRNAAKDAELLESVKERGVEVALLVRPRAKGGGVEVVCGARRLEAATAAGRRTVPCDVREDLDDEAALQLQLVEHEHREDWHPLDEADAYKRLVDEYRRDADWVAAHVHKPVAHVRRRLQLVHLGETGRAEWIAGRISEDAAYVLSRVPAQLQSTALEAAVQHNTPKDWEAQNGKTFDVVSGGDMRDVVRKEMTLPIAAAPFDMNDAELVAKAGSCTTCPKRTGAQPALFADLNSADDLCTDTSCYADKCDARWAQVQTEARASKGKIKLLSAAETKKLYPHEHNVRVSYGSDWIDVDEERYDATTSGKPKTARSLFTPETMPPVAYAQRPDGVPVTLIAKADYEKATRAKKASGSGAGGGGSRSSSGVSEKEKAKQKKAREEQKRKDAIAKLTQRRVVAAFVSAAETSQLGDSLQVRALIIDLMEERHPSSLDEVVERRGLSRDDAATGKRLDADEVLARFAAESKLPELCGLWLELLLICPSRVLGERQDLAKVFRVNIAAIKSAAEKELERLAEQTHTKLPGKGAAKETPAEAAKRSDAVMRATAERVKGKPAKPTSAKPGSKSKPAPAPAKKSGASKSKAKVRA